MAPPAKGRTWQFGIGIGAGGTFDLRRDCAETLLAIKNALKSFGTFPWAVVGSSNGVAAGLDGVDRWGTWGDFNWSDGGSSLSWFVLRQTHLLATHQVCIACDATDGGVQGPNLSIIFTNSPAGFTGGSATTRPTAAVEWQPMVGAYWLGVTGLSPTARTRIQAMQSTAGDCTRVVVHSNGKPVFFFIDDSVSDFPTGWATPTFATAIGSSTGASCINFDLSGQGWASGAFFQLYMGGLYYRGMNAGERQTLPNSFTHEHPMFPVGVASKSLPQRGRMGQLIDLYWGSRALGEGAAYPDASRLWVKFGDLVFPWDGSVPLIS